MPTLVQFAEIIKTNKSRLKRMYAWLKELERRCDAIPGPRMSEEARGSSGGNPMEMNIMKKLDYEEKIKWYESMDVLYKKWLKFMTPREASVFDLVYMKSKSLDQAATILKVSYQNVYNYKLKLHDKWEKFSISK